MALTAKETADIEAAMAEFMEKRRPPVDIRDRLDLAYPPDAEALFFEEFLEVVDKDETGCFWG